MNSFFFYLIDRFKTKEVGQIYLSVYILGKVHLI